jgi:hypothetical protein
MRSKKVNRQRKLNTQSKNRVMIDNLSLIEKGSALPGPKQTPGQQKQRNWNHRTIPAVVGPTAALLTGCFNDFMNHLRTLIFNDCLIMALFSMIFLLFMIFIIYSVVVCIF